MTEAHGPAVQAEAPARIAILDPLRGLAALAVMWFHFTNGGPLFKGGGAFNAVVRGSGHYGWTGVEFFFVISGFVLPYALERGGYRLRDYGTFLAKRLLRLEPPYLVSLVLALVLWWAASQSGVFRGDPFRLEWARLLLHFGYLNTHFGYPAYNPVYWTLGIELQFYLGLALLHPLLLAKRAGVRILWLLALAAGSLLPAREDIILRYLPLFVLGLATYHQSSGRLTRTGWLAILAAALALGSRALSLPALASAALAALLIGGLSAVEPPDRGAKRIVWRSLAWSGRVSYSIYLLHVLVGGRVINLGARWAGGWAASLIVLALACASSLLAAWALHRWVEAPSQRLSARMRFRGKMG